eukprot:gene36208-59266_t
MIRSLAAITILALTVAGCSPSTVKEPAATATPALASATKPQAYRAARSPTLEAVRQR